MHGLSSAIKSRPIRLATPKKNLSSSKVLSGSTFLFLLRQKLLISYQFPHYTCLTLPLGFGQKTARSIFQADERPLHMDLWERLAGD